MICHLFCTPHGTKYHVIKIITHPNGIGERAKGLSFMRPVEFAHCVAN